MPQEKSFQSALDDVLDNIYVIRCLQPKTRGSKNACQSAQAWQLWVATS
jgi:hypothetical protein